ncbi:GDSL esterase/lipase, partial [Melia azedarach]
MTTKILIFKILTVFSIILPSANSVDFNYPAVFNFGDSNSDTGELGAGLGFSLTLLMDKLTSRLQLADFVTAGSS